MRRRGEEETPFLRRHARTLRLDRRTVLATVLPAVLTACSTAPPDSFDLAAVPSGPARQARRAVISIEESDAPAILASNRVAIRRPGGDYAYLAGAQWSDVLTRLVQRRLIASFENAKLFQAVAETGTASDFILASEIRRFEVDGQSNQAVVEIAVRLVAARTGHTVQGFVATGTAPAPTTGAAAITASLDRAFAQAAERILQFAVTRT